MSTASKAGKILRIGVIQNGKIMEERLLKKHQSVTVGEHPKSTFVLPIGASHLDLFEFKGGRYYLVFNGQMQGRVSVQNSVMDLDALRTKNIAKRRGDAFHLPLTEKTRGKLVLRDVTLLFQFVNRPPAVPKQQLPAVVKGSWLSSMDWSFATIFAACVVLLLGGGIWADVWWQKIGQYLPRYEKENPLMDMMHTQVRSKPKDEDQKKKNEKKEDKKSIDKQLSKRKAKVKVTMPTRKVIKPIRKHNTPSPERMKRLADMRHRRVTSSVRKKTFLHMLGSKGKGDGLFINTLSKGKVSRRLETALDGKSGVKMAKTGDVRNYTGGPKYNNSGGIKLAKFGDKVLGKNTRIKSVRTGNRDTELKIRGLVKTSGGNQTGGLGKLSKSQVTSVIRRRLSRIKACYERGLKMNPKLSGKVVVQFTIAESGRVSTASLSDNSVDSSVGSCILNTIKRMKFGTPEGGSVTFSYPFVFLPKG
ncbi:MAG: energy transducer TonB [Myxococcales bacterium]|nr:energy transducer TonB [Myxococcales bacterium]